MQTIQVRLTKELIKKAKDLVQTGLYSNKSEVIRDSLRRLIFQQIYTAKRNHKIIYTSDLHGNATQYKKLLKRAFESKAESVIIGGDITPKDKKHRTIKYQKEFIEKKLIPIIKKFNNKNKSRSHKCITYIIMGNDDFKSNYKILKKYENIIKLIQDKCIKFYEDFKIIGYSYVPITPFIYKDWEKPDLNIENEYKTRKPFTEKGFINKTKKTIIDLKNRKTTIEKDINKLMKNKDPKKVILVAHAPPFKTNLDLMKNNKHIGSFAIKKLIQKKHPYLTMHGHVHETVDLSKNFKEINGNTVSITSGNNYKNNKLAMVELNLYEPEKAIRRII